MDRERREFARTAPRRSPAGENPPRPRCPTSFSRGGNSSAAGFTRIFLGFWVWVVFFFPSSLSSHAAIPGSGCSQPGGEWEERDARRVWENPELFQPCSTWRGGSGAAGSLRELLRRLWSRRIDGEALKAPTPFLTSTMDLPSTKDFQWKSLAPLPSRRVYSTLVEAGGQVFAVGGCDDNGVPVDSFEVYSPEADRWVELPAMPTARAGVAVTVLGKRIMVVGGVGAGQLPLKVVEMYHTDEGRWRKRSSLREAAMGISVTAKDYRVYAAGGMGSDLRPHNFLQHYDVLKDIWVSLAAMPTPRYAATSVLRGTKIYVLGGRQSKYAVNAFEVFDTESRSWTKFPSIPNKRAFSSFVPTEEKLFSLGGLRQGRLYRQPKFMRTVDVFDLEQGGWMKMERSCYLKKRRADFVAGYLRGRVVVAGGLGNQPTVLESAEAFHPEKNKWESLPPMPTPRCACSSIALRDCLLAVGGVSQGLSTAVEALCLSDS